MKKSNFRTMLSMSLLIMLLIGNFQAPFAVAASAVVPQASVALPPLMIDRKPAAGQEAALDAPIEVHFDQPMDTKSVQAAWQMKDSTGRAVLGDFSWPEPSRLVYKTARLQPESTYEVTIGEKAAGQNGVPLAQAISFQVNTVAALKINQVFPAPGADQIDPAARITVFFSRPVVALGIAEDQAKLVQPFIFRPEVTGKGEWINTSTYIFTPDPALKSNSRYDVQIKSGLPDVTGLPDTQLAQPFAWSFTTLAPGLESLEIGGQSINPLDAFVPVDIPLAPKITLSFRQPMDTGSVERGLVLTSAGTNIPIKQTWNSNATIVTLAPVSPLKMGTRYTINLKKGTLAQDGGSLSLAYSWNFHSVASPAVTSTVPSNGQRSTQQSFEINFASPMNLKSVRDRIDFNPPIDSTNNSWYDESQHKLYFYGLASSTKYTVTLKPGMLDIYGNAITKGSTIQFTTAPLYPFVNLLAPYESMLRTNGPQEISLRYTNILTVQLKLYRMTAQEYIVSRENYQPIETVSFKEADLVWQGTETSTARTDEVILKKIKLSEADGKPLPAGFYFIGMSSPQIEHKGSFMDGRYLVVTSANLTLKTTLNDALMWVTGYEDGKPVAGVPLKIYDRFFNNIASGTTDTNGLVTTSLPASNEDYASRYAMSSDGQVFAFASSNWGSGVNPEDFGISGQYYGPLNNTTAYIYSDRPLYRPGQPVYFKGIVRFDKDLAYSLPDQKDVEIVIRSFDKEVYRQKLDLSAFGSFHGQFDLDDGAALGAYSLTARFTGADRDIGSLGFTVAEYRKPEFQVNLDTEAKDVLGGRNFKASLLASYYSGGGVGGADVTWTLTSNPFYFTPPEEYSGFSFYDDSRDSDRYQFGRFQEDRSRVIAEGKGVTTADGSLMITLPADISKEAASRTLMLDTTVTDFSGFSVSGQVQIIAHQSEVYVGARAKQYIGRVGQPQTFDLVALDWSGKPVAGQKVDVVISERQWFSVQEQDAQGNLNWTTSVKDVPVKTLKGIVVNEKGLATVDFTPTKGGIYRALVTGRDRFENAASAAAYIWVAGADYIPWRQSNDRSFQLVADRDTYQPGDTAEIMIASPFQGSAYALVTVERGSIRSQEVLHLESNSTVFRLPVTADMAPIVYVSVVVVKGIDANSPRPNFKVGMVKLNVSTREQALNVSVIPDKKQVAPGQSVTYQVKTSDSAGKPVQAEVSLGLSDLATLSLLPPNTINILDYFYAPRSLSVRTSISISASQEDYNAQLQAEPATGRGGGSGGGKGEGSIGVPEVRQEFPDTAFWKADLLTDDSGQASVSITLPDNLTTWRMDARSATRDTRVGQTTADLVSSLPLLVRPQTPRFFVAGDKVTLGAAVQNNTGQDLKITVGLDAKGLDLTAASVQEIELKNGAKQLVTWQANVPVDSQRVDLVFNARGGDFSDASRPTLGTLDNNGIPVYRYEAPETVSTAGEVDAAGSRTEVIRLPADMAVTQGELNVKIEPSLAAGMTAGLSYLEHYPYECTEQTVSRFLPNVLTTAALKAAGSGDAKLEQNLKIQVNQALQKLYNTQNADGGWGWWPGGTSDQNTSAYVILGMVEAQKAGYVVDSTTLNKGISFLQSQLSILASDKKQALEGGRNRQAFLLYVLARAGSPDVSRTVQLYNDWQSLGLYGRALLMQSLALIDPQDPRLDTLRSNLVSQAVISASGAHWEEKVVDRWNWNTDTRTTAIVLASLIQVDPANAVNANAVRWLMVNRRQGTWGSTQETAWSLMALTGWMVQSGELAGSYSYQVNLNDKSLLDGKVDASNLRQTREQKVNITALLKDQANALVFSRIGDAGRMYYTGSLNVYLPVPQIRSLDQGMTLTRRYYTLKDLKTPVTQASQGDLLLARMTIVVPKSLHYLLIEDPLPAGLEAVDSSLKTSPQPQAPDLYDWQRVAEDGWGWWFFSHAELRDEKLVLSTDYLPAGTYIYTYLVRASTIGTFQVIPTTGQEFYFPEVYGRGDGSTFEVKP